MRHIRPDSAFSLGLDKRCKANNWAECSATLRQMLSDTHGDALRLGGGQTKVIEILPGQLRLSRSWREVLDIVTLSGAHTIRPSANIGVFNFEDYSLGDCAKIFVGKVQYEE